MDSPATDPRSQAVKAKRLQSPGPDQFVYLHSEACALVRAAQVIIDHHPAAMGKSLPIAVDIATDIGVGIENEQPNLPRAQDLADSGDRVRIERAAIYQGNLIEESEAFQIFCQIFETVLCANPRMI